MKPPRTKATKHADALARRIERKIRKAALEAEAEGWNNLAEYLSSVADKLYWGAPTGQP